MAERQINLPPGFEIEEPEINLPQGFEVEIEGPEDESFIKQTWGALMKGGMKHLGQAVLEAPVHAGKFIKKFADFVEAPVTPEQEAERKRVYGPSKTAEIHKRWIKQHKAGQKIILERHPEWKYDPPENFLDLLTSPRKLSLAVTESLPLMIGAGITTAAGRPDISLAMMYSSEGQEAYDQAIDYGATEEEAEMAYHVYGSIASVLEYAQLKGIMNISKKSFNRIVGRVAQKTAGKTLTREIIEVAAKEALQESAQGAWGEATAKIVYDKPVEGGLVGFIDRRAQEGLIGGTMGLIPGLGGAVTGVITNKASGRTEKITAIENLKSQVEESEISEKGKVGILQEFDRITEDISEGKFDIAQPGVSIEGKTATIPGTQIGFDQIKAPITGVGGENIVEFFKDDKKVHQIRTKNRAQQREQETGYRQLLAEEATLTQALPAAQQDAADTLKQFQTDAVTRSQELQQMEYEELLTLAQDGDELAAWRIGEIDAERALEAGLPKFEVLFGEMLEGNEAAKNAIYNGEYQGGRARQEALETVPVVEEKVVPLTKAKEDWVDWALGPMSDLWTTESGAFERDGKQYTDVDLPRLENEKLVLSSVEEINEDLLYRLEEQAPSIADTVSEQAKARTAGKLATEIRKQLEAVPPQSKARVDPTVPATDKQVFNFATIKVHALAKLMGINKTDRQRIQQDIVGKKSMKDMDMEEAKRIEAYFVAEAKKRGLTTSSGKELAEVIKQHTTQKKVQELAGVEPVAWKKIMQTPGRLVSHFFYSSKRVERLLEAFDGFTEGPVYNSVWAAVHTALVGSRTSYGNRVGKFKETLVDIMTPELNTEEGIAGAIETIQAEEEAAGKKARKLGKRAVRKLVGNSLWARYKTSGREVILEPTGTNPGLSLNASERIGMYLAMKNEDSRTHLFEGTLAAFDNPALAALEVVQKMSTQEKQIGDWMLADLEANFNRANQAAVIGLGRTLDQQDNYFPIKVKDTAELQTKDFLSLLEDKYTKQAFKAEPSEVKERVKGAGQPLDLNSFSVYLGHLKRIEQFIHMAPVAKSVGNILNTREFRQAVNNKTSGHGSDILDKWLKNSIRGHAMGPEARRLVPKTELWMRQKGVLFSLARNIPSVARQFISGFNTAATHPTILAYAATNIAESIDPRYFKQLENRMKELSPEMKTRNFDRYLANVKHQAKAAGMLSGKKEWSEKALSWQRWADNRTVVISWNAFYDSARESEAVQKQFELDGSDEAAIAFANKMIGRTQPMGNIEHLPDFFVGSTIERLLSTFQNQVNNNWNFWAHDIYGMRKAGKISKKMVAWRILFSNILPSMMFGTISRGGLPDDWKDVVFDWAAYSINPIFLLGRLVIDAALGFAGGQTSVEDILPATAAKAVGAAIRGDPKKAALYGLKTVGGLTGRIPNQAIRTGQGIYDIQTGETDDLRRLIYSDWSLTNYGWPGGKEEKEDPGFI